MGCWNGICAISHLPILKDDPVRFLLIAQNKGHNYGRSGDSITDFWYPFLVPLRASYNDYGSIENCEKGINLTYWEYFVRKHVVERPVGENEYHDLAIKKDQSFKLFLKCLSGGRILFDFVENGELLNGSGVIINYTMIREDVYQHMLSMYRKFRGMGVLETEKLKARKHLDCGLGIMMHGLLFYEFVHYIDYLSLPGAEPVAGIKRSDLIDLLSTDLVEFMDVSWLMGRLNLSWNPRMNGGQSIDFGLHESFYQGMLDLTRCLERTNYDLFESTFYDNDL